MAIVVEDYTKIYDRVAAVAGLSFQVEAGEILGLVGPNGAGKTTTMRALAGIIVPTSGRLMVAGHDLKRDPVAAKQALAYVPDDPHLFENLTVWEHFQFIASAYRLRDWIAHAESILARFELTAKRDEPCSDLSRGMRQKVAIGCGYLHDPAVIMLDEPLTGLDPRGIRTMRDSIRDRAERGAAVMISSHLLALVEDLCTSVLLLVQGRKVAQGKIAELRQVSPNDGQTESLEQLFFRLTETAEPAESPPAVASSHPITPEADG